MEVVVLMNCGLLSGPERVSCGGMGGSGCKLKYDSLGAVCYEWLVGNLDALHSSLSISPASFIRKNEPCVIRSAPLVGNIAVLYSPGYSRVIFAFQNGVIRTVRLPLPSSSSSAVDVAQLQPAYGAASCRSYL